MLLVGLIASMNVFTDQISDWRLTLNDLYMSLFMTGLMFFFMGLLSAHKYQILFGLLIIISSYTAIRTQFLISQNQYLSGMIPHHSMAIFLSKQLLDKSQINPNVRTLAYQIIDTQTKEISQIKTFLQSPPL